MSIKQKILLASLNKAREKELSLREELKNFDRKNPKWSMNAHERKRRKDELQKKIEKQAEILAELRLYLNGGARDENR